MKKLIYLDESKESEMKDEINILYSRFQMVSEILSKYDVIISNEIITYSLKIKLHRYLNGNFCYSPDLYKILSEKELIKRCEVQSIIKEIYNTIRKDNVMDFDWWSDNILSYISVHNGKIIISSNIDETIKNQIGLFIEKKESLKALRLHQTIAKNINEFVRTMKKVPAIDITNDITALFQIQEDGEVKPAPINYDNYTN